MTETIIYTVEVDGDEYDHSAFRELVIDTNGASIETEAESPSNDGSYFCEIELRGDRYDHVGLRGQIVEFHGATITSERVVDNPDTPVNFRPIADSFILAMRAHGDVPDDTIDEIVATVEASCPNNERHLMWEDDYNEFMSILDGVLDSIDGNGYSGQIERLDTLRAKLEADP